MSDKLIDLIQSIAERLGFEAARIWPQIVMVTWVTSLFWVIVDPILLTLCILGEYKMVRWAINRYKRSQPSTSYGSDIGFDLIMLVGFGSLIPLTLGFVALVTFPDNLAGLLFPEAKTVLRLAGK